MFSILLTLVGGFLVIKYWAQILKHIKLVLLAVAVVFAAIVLIEGARAEGLASTKHLPNPEQVSSIADYK